MSEIIQRFEPGTLWATVKNRTNQAIERGAIQTIPTHSELVEEGGVNFLIRIISSLVRKAQAQLEQQPSPSLPLPPRIHFFPMILICLSPTFPTPMCVY